MDLRDPENQPDVLHPRFDLRVFSAFERARLAADASAHATRWKMWAAKESAFKVARKLDERARFLPLRFRVRLLDGTRAVVRHAADRFDVRFEETEDWVHAVATRWGESVEALPSFAVEALPSLSVEALPSFAAEPLRRGCAAAAQASGRVRELARGAIGRVMSIAPSEIEISRIGRIPVALRDRIPLDIDFSLSHHGRFLACAWSRSPKS